MWPERRGELNSSYKQTKKSFPGSKNIVRTGFLSKIKPQTSIVTIEFMQNYSKGICFRNPALGSCRVFPQTLFGENPTAPSFQIDHSSTTSLLSPTEKLILYRTRDSVRMDRTVVTKTMYLAILLIWGWFTVDSQKNRWNQLVLNVIWEFRSS